MPRSPLLSILIKVEHSEGKRNFGAFRASWSTVHLLGGGLLRVLSLENALAGPKGLLRKLVQYPALRILILEVSITLGAKLGKYAGDLKICISTLTVPWFPTWYPTLDCAWCPHPYTLLLTSRLQRLRLGPLLGLGEAEARIGGK